MDSKNKLIFVYNAKSDKLNAMVDFAHKIVSPSTYKCSLCKLTHTNLGERKEWNDFYKDSNIEMEFHHFDEFEKLYDNKYQYPIVLKKSHSDMFILINSERLNEVKNVSDLIDTIKNTMN